MRFDIQGGPVNSLVSVNTVEDRYPPVSPPLLYTEDVNRLGYGYPGLPAWRRSGGPVNTLVKPS